MMKIHKKESGWLATPMTSIQESNQIEELCEELSEEDLKSVSGGGVEDIVTGLLGGLLGGGGGEA